MKLTKDQRFTAYCVLLEEYVSEWHLGICGAAWGAFQISLDEDRRFSNFKKYFPELWKKRDRGEDESSALLWHNHIDRIAALKQCIIETHP